MPISKVWFQVKMAVIELRTKKKRDKFTAGIKKSYLFIHYLLLTSYSFILFINLCVPFFHSITVVRYNFPNAQAVSSIKDFFYALLFYIND